MGVNYEPVQLTLTACSFLYLQPQKYVQFRDHLISTAAKSHG